MVRKKRVQHLDGRQRSLVENALYYANPPETPQIVHATLPPMLQYIQKLLYKDLNKVNTEKVSCNVHVRAYQPGLSRLVTYLRRWLCCFAGLRYMFI